ncbi:MAG: hypothetical protein JKX81_19230 [Arenicella sp.]|nr:hypothetical protein [Arenicella sp.]
MPILIIALLFGYFWWYQRYIPVEKPIAKNVLKEVLKGSISVEPHLWLNENQKRSGIVRFHINSSGGRPNLNKSIVTITSGTDKIVHSNMPNLERLSELSLIKTSFKVHQIVTAKLLTLKLELNTGQTLDFSWPLESVDSREASKVTFLNH